MKIILMPRRSSRTSLLLAFGRSVCLRWEIAAGLGDQCKWREEQ